MVGDSNCADLSWQYLFLTFSCFDASSLAYPVFIIEPSHDKTYYKTCVTSEDSDSCTVTQFGKVFVNPSLDSPETVEGTCDQQIGLRGCAGVFAGRTCPIVAHFCIILQYSRYLWLNPFSLILFLSAIMSYISHK